jgi:hypothetical protein
MFECGISLAYCRLMLTILDITFSTPCIGTLVGHRFKERLGVREGAVESPQLFNMYIAPLRQRLIDQHPRLCKMLGIIIAAVLYADDAALPADNLEDLQLAVDIFEEFCNDYQLFIAVGKTFLTVFHDESDTGVHYEGKSVWVDGSKATVRVYGEEIAAAQSFKYLGVTIDCHGSNKAHLKARLQAFSRAVGLLLAGLARLPSYTHSFVLYLWTTLVAPVLSYGMEQFAWNDDDLSPNDQSAECLLQKTT